MAIPSDDMTDFAHAASRLRVPSETRTAAPCQDDEGGWPLERSQGGEADAVRFGGHERKGPPAPGVPSGARMAFISPPDRHVPRLKRKEQLQ